MRPKNLPAMLSTFVGREREVREIGKLLEGERLVTLTGPAGSGKTRLALEVARRSLGVHPEGSWFVDLAPLVDDALVARTFAHAVGVVEQPPRALVDSLADHLRPREVMLVVDNCEHVLAASAALVDALLRACPNLWVLATSREPLGVPGEVRWRVPSLSTPAVPSERALETEPARPVVGSLEGLLELEAPRLFVDRCRALVTDQSFTDADAPALAQICVRLDGIPLAIELAAACITVLSVEQIAARLDDRFRLLTLGPRTAQARQRTLQRSVEWSHDLLTPRQQLLFRRLSVLAGGFTLEAAEDVGAAGEGIDRAEVFDLLVGLVHKSLVVSRPGGSRDRYGFLETIRHFARDRLVESGEEAAVRDAHLAWCASLVAEAEPRLSGPDRQVWFERIDAEIDNIRTALAWACSRGDREAVLRIAGALTRYWHVRGYYPEGRRWSDAALASAGAPPLARAQALWGPVVGLTLWARGEIARSEGRAAEAEVLYGEALRLRQAIGDGPGILDSLEALAGLAAGRGQAVRAALLLAAAAVHRTTSGCARPVPGHAAYDANLAQARAGLPDVAFERAWAEGRRLSRDEAVALALGDAPVP